MTKVKFLPLLVWVGLAVFPNRLQADVIMAIAGAAYSCNLTHHKHNEAPTASGLPARFFLSQIGKECAALSPMKDKSKWKGDFAI